MNKKANTIIFILAATGFNIIVTMLCFLLLLLFYSRFIFPLLPEESVAWALPGIFVGSIVASVLIYRLVVKLLMKKVEMEKYFDPIFGRRPPRK
jgi:hypothetical protein